MANIYKEHDVIGARIHGALRQCIEDIKEARQISDSQVVKEALSLYVDRHEDADVPEPVQKVLNQSEQMRETLAEDYYIQQQNFKVSTKLKELTFIEYMDKNIAVVYLANKPHMDEDSLKEHMRESLEALRERAVHHGYEHQWKNRKEYPIEYAEEFLERKNLEEKAFNDFMDSI